MEIKFFFELDKIPSATSQGKGYNRYTHAIYTNKRVQAVKDLYQLMFRMHKPAEPFDCPVRVSVVFHYPARRKKDIGKGKTTKPDLDNMVKTLLDAGTAEKYWTDDARISELHLSKIYSNIRGIEFHVEPIEEVTE